MLVNFRLNELLLLINAILPILPNDVSSGGESQMVQ